MIEKRRFNQRRNKKTTLYLQYAQKKMKNRNITKKGKGKNDKIILELRTCPSQKPLH
jgi:hypothetical protein